MLRGWSSVGQPADEFWRQLSIDDEIHDAIMTTA
jgi:hypothetical protein